jgi:hypothetical protein
MDENPNISLNPEYLVFDCMWDDSCALRWLIIRLYHRTYSSKKFRIDESDDFELSLESKNDGTEGISYFIVPSDLVEVQSFSKTRYSSTSR